MVRLQDISIQRKLTLIIMVASTVAVLLVSGGFVTYELFTYQRTTTRHLSTLAEIIGNESTAALSFGDPDTGNEVLQALTAERQIAGAALYRYKDGKLSLFAQYPAHDNTPGRFPADPGPPGVREEGDFVILVHDIHDPSGLAGAVYLKSDLLDRRERFNRYAAIVLLFLAASSAATYFLSFLLQRIVSRPIFHLAETARTVSLEKNYGVRAVKHGEDELGQLIDGFNAMLGQIQERDVALQQAHDKLERRVEERTHDLRNEVIERRRAEQGLQQQFVRISLLNQITHAISERQDTDSILHVVLRQLEDHLGLDLGMVMLFDAAADKLNVAALRVHNPLLAPKFDLHEGSVLPFASAGLQPCKEGQTVYISNTLKEAPMLIEKLAGAGWRSAVAAPLLVDEKLFGVLLAARVKSEGFTSGDSEFLRMLSEHVALAAHQAGLHAELARAYNELRQTQQAVMQQERLKALGQMASGIAHDVNNALSPVVGFSDLLLQGQHGLTADGKKYLKHIRTAGEDIAHIVSRLREFYRRRDEQESLQELNLNALAEQVVDMTRPRWRDIPQSNGVTIAVQPDLAPSVPRLVGIESEVREALTNLVLNAVDALPGGGTITVRSRVAGREAGAGTESTHVVLEVSDTGVGMSEETRKRCLEPFFSTKGKRGTGLGLAMVYGVMQRHEGSIAIDSEVGRGTTFRLAFPVRKLRVTDSNDRESDKPLKPLKILCIDDEPLLRELLKEMLERDHHRVEVSEDGLAGLEAFRTARHGGGPFDVVITDLGMPHLDGRQVATAIKHESPATPVVMLTGWGAFMKEDGSQPVPVDGVLSKPPRSGEIRQMLRRVTTVSPAGGRAVSRVALQ
jgi:signal transduction histidine kinase/ActR/RegA family two-component response regulator